MSKKSARRGRVAALRPVREAALLDLDLSIGDTEDLTLSVETGNACEDCGTPAILLLWSAGSFRCGGCCGSGPGLFTGLSAAARSQELAAVGICAACGDELECDEDGRCWRCCAEPHQAGSQLLASAVALRAAGGGDQAHA